MGLQQQQKTASGKQAAIFFTTAVVLQHVLALQNVLQRNHAICVAVHEEGSTSNINWRHRSSLEEVDNFFISLPYVQKKK